MMNILSTKLFPTILNMSITAGVVILFVLAARLLLRKAPKLFSYALWAVVLFRLLCPVSIPSDLSLLGLLDTPAATVTRHTTTVSYLSQNAAVITVPPSPAPDHGGAASEAPAASLPQPSAPSAGDPLSFPALAAPVWLAGVACMVAYSVISFLRLRRRLVGAALLRHNIYLADHIDSPFVMGLLRAKIYLPSSLPAREQGYILLHEQHHIRRLDHIVKALAFLALCVHWFNPLVWAAFLFSSRDMEMSCDEAVMKALGEDIRADYSSSLLSLATGRRIIAGTPLAFGEGDTRSRIKNVLNWKKPRLWIALLAAVVCVFVIAACAGNPKDNTTGPDGPAAGENTPTSEFTSMEDYVNAVAAGKTTLELSVYEEPVTSIARNPVIFPVADCKLGELTLHGSLDALDPGGTLEVWTYYHLTKADLGEVAPESIVLAGGAYMDDDGYIFLDDTRIVIALRREDGTYDILDEQPYGDGLDFFGYHESSEEALYDWYVKENDLGLPLYVEDWISRVTIPEGGSLGNFPVHRYDGDGWYLYIPVSAWTQTAAADAMCQWASLYWTGSALTVERFDTPLSEQYAAAEQQGFSPVDDIRQVWELSGSSTIRYYFFTTGDGVCWRVKTEWIGASITDYPYIAMEPDILRLMAESFTVTGAPGDETAPTV